ncbi:hypothetical protein lerEdw1_005395 [Lerista edwardsae]|nr:hypothetical protein lerEdw1_005395 [Lerista edwardsae]
MQRFIEIDRAWKILGNEETKKEYDLQRREHELTQGWPVDAQVSLEDMAWNCQIIEATVFLFQQEISAILLRVDVVEHTQLPRMKLKIVH